MSLPKLGGDAKVLLLEKWRGDLPGSSVRMVGICSSGPPVRAPLREGASPDGVAGIK